MSKLEKYSSYKDSGVEWLGEIPEGWEVKRIKHLFNIGRGRVISQQELDEDGLFPVYSSQTKNNGVLGYVKTYDYDCKQITWTTDGANAGTVFLRQGKHNCTNVCGTLQNRNKNEVLEFVNYSLQIAAQFYKRPDTNGAKIMNNEMAGISITYPPKQEQAKIAAFLDTKTEQLDKAIKQKEQLIELLKERRQILINDAVTKGIDKTVAMKDSGVEWIGEIPESWEVKKLKYLSRKIADGLHGTPKYSSDTDYFFINGNNLLNAKIKLTDQTNTVDYKEYIKYQDNLDNQTILISINGTIGNLAFYNNEKVILGKSAGFIKLNYNINKNYIINLLESSYIDSFFQIEFTGSTIKNISLATLHNIPCIFPPKKDQEEIIKYIEKNNQKIDKAIDLQQQQITKLKEYKTTLIDSVVTGKVRVV